VGDGACGLASGGGRCVVYGGRSVVFGGAAAAASFSDPAAAATFLMVPFCSLVL